MGEDLFPEVVPHLGLLDEDQRYTPREAVEWCQRLAGVRSFDLDVAACIAAHHAEEWYGPERSGRESDGLRAPWWGHVFCNPPWSDIRPWVQRAWKVWADTRSASDRGLKTITMLLPGNRTHRPWWQELVEPVRDRGPVGGVRFSTHFAPKRFAYGGPGNPLGIGVQEPNFTSVALHWRLK